MNRCFHQCLPHLQLILRNLGRLWLAYKELVVWQPGVRMLQTRLKFFFSSSDTLSYWKGSWASFDWKCPTFLWKSVFQHLGLCDHVLWIVCDRVHWKGLVILLSPRRKIVTTSDYMILLVNEYQLCMQERNRLKISKSNWQTNRHCQIDYIPHTQKTKGAEGVIGAFSSFYQ